jgi:hypothetical protein
MVFGRLDPDQDLDGQKRPLTEIIKKVKRKVLFCSDECSFECSTLLLYLERPLWRSRDIDQKIAIFEKKRDLSLVKFTNLWFQIHIDLKCWIRIPIQKKPMRIHNTGQNILEALWLVGNSYYFHFLGIDDDIEALLQEQPDYRNLTASFL